MEAAMLDLLFIAIGIAFLGAAMVARTPPPSKPMTANSPRWPAR